MEPVFLRGMRVSLRPLVKATDFERCLCWINDPDIRRHLTSYLPVTEREETEFFDRERSDDFTLAIVINEGEPRHIGNIGAHKLRRETTAEIGIMIGEKGEWGKGYGTDAAMTLIRWMYDDLKLHKIAWLALMRNEPSIRIAGRCGFREEAVLKEEWYRDGRYLDLVRLAVFRPDFERAYGAYVESARISNEKA